MGEGYGAGEGGEAGGTKMAYEARMKPRTRGIIIPTLCCYNAISPGEGGEQKTERGRGGGTWLMITWCLTSNIV